MITKQVCALCKKALSDPRHGWWHMLACRRVKQQQAASIYWHRVGYDKMGLRSGAVRHKIAMDKRLELFKTMAPDAYRLLGHDAVVTFIERQKQRHKKSGPFLRPLVELERIIRRTYPR